MDVSPKLDDFKNKNMKNEAHSCDPNPQTKRPIASDYFLADAKVWFSAKKSLFLLLGLVLIPTQCQL